jgi:alpha-1,2-mannosyltransferase
MSGLLAHCGDFLFLCYFAAGVVVINRVISESASIWTRALVAAAMVLMSLAAFWLSTPPQVFFDYLFAYYPAGLAVLHNDANALRTLTGPAFVNMPVVAYAFAPFALLGPKIGAALLSTIGIILVAIAWFILVRLARLGTRERWLLALIFIGNGPLINGIKFANTSYFILFALVAALHFIRAGRSWLAGILLGVSAVVKPPILLFAVFFLLRRDLRGLLGFLGSCGVIILLSLGSFGWADNMLWLEKCVLQFRHQWLTGFTVQSVPAFIFRFNAAPAVLTDWSAHAPTLGQQIWADAIIGVLFVIAAVVYTRSAVRSQHMSASSDTKRDLQFLLVLCLCLVTSPLSWSHYYAWLLLPMAFFLGRDLPHSVGTRWLAWLGIALIVPPVIWPVSSPSSLVMLVYTSIIESRLLLGGIIWFCIVAWQLSRAGDVLPLSTTKSGDAVASA